MLHGEVFHPNLKSFDMLMPIQIGVNMAAKTVAGTLSLNLAVETKSYHSKINLELRNIRINTSSSARTCSVQQESPIDNKVKVPVELKRC